MNDKIFRQKSVDRVSSPEQLNDYIKVANPGVWILLVAVAVLLIGVCVWGFVGKLDTKISAAAISKNGTVVCYVSAENIEKVKENLPVIIDGKEYAIKEIASSSVTIGEDFDKSLLEKGGFTVGQYVYQITLDASLAEGVYSSQVVIERVSPMSFVIN